MTQTRFFDDPKNGAAYAGRERLTASDFNDWIGGIRYNDLAHELATLFNWPFVSDTAATLGAGALNEATLDTSLHRYVCVGDAAGNPVAGWSNNLRSWTVASTPPPAGAGLSNPHVAASGAGVYVMGGSVAGNTTQKIRRSTDGDTWAIQNTAAFMSEDVACVIWDPINSLFLIGLLNCGGTSTVETSPDGIVWTARSVGFSSGVSGIASNGTDLLVCAINAPAGTNCASSPDGVTWTPRTLPVNKAWLDVAYCPNQGKWLMCAADATLTYSSDGVTWNTVVPSWPDAAPTFEGNTLTATENFFVATGLVNIGGVNKAMVLASDDAGTTWFNADEFENAGGNAPSSLTYVGGQLMGTCPGDYVYGSLRTTINYT